MGSINVRLNSIKVDGYIPTIIKNYLKTTGVENLIHYNTT